MLKSRIQPGAQCPSAPPPRSAAYVRETSILLDNFWFAGILLLLKQQSFRSSFFIMHAIYPNEQIPFQSSLCTNEMMNRLAQNTTKPRSVAWLCVLVMSVVIDRSGIKPETNQR